jgi:hypothetical protein
LKEVNESYQDSKDNKSLYLLKIWMF